MFVACIVALNGRILLPVDKGCSWMVSGRKLACTGAAKELSGTPGRGSHAGVWKPRCGVAGCILWHAGAWNPHCSVAGCSLGYAIAWDSTL